MTLAMPTPAAPTTTGFFRDSLREADPAIYDAIRRGTAARSAITSN